LTKLADYSREIVGLIQSSEITNSRQLNEAKIKLCKKHSLSGMPSNATILSFAGTKTEPLLRLLKVKPTRSLSGISVVAIMAKPFKCPGSCIYCPSSLLPEKETPKSYTGREPATMRAVNSGFDAKTQVKNRVKQLEEAGHGTGKLELIVMGGTFLSTPALYQKKFMLDSINALSGSNAKSLEPAKKAAERTSRRIVGITFETRPDFCSKKDISRMLSFGGTRCELGIQSIYPEVLEKIKRGHSVSEAIAATRRLKDSAFKVTYHYMPGLPGVSLQEDKKALLEIFKNPDFRPDALKIYPCLVIEGTELFRQWKKGLFTPLSTKNAVKLLSSVKPNIPDWVRVMRIQRDIPSPLISAGVKKSNLRQLVQEELSRHGKKCGCIRCREAGLLSSKGLRPAPEKAKLFTEEYKASQGREFFFSWESKKRDCLFGFARLRIPARPFLPEISPESGLLRELRVFGLPLPLHERKEQALQHKGLGKKLVEKAILVSEENGLKEIVAISGLGVKPYYRSLGFKAKGPYMAKRV
jgi:elongator complex protein 3